MIVVRFITKEILHAVLKVLEGEQLLIKFDGDERALVSALNKISSDFWTPPRYDSTQTASESFRILPTCSIRQN